MHSLKLICFAWLIDFTCIELHLLNFRSASVDTDVGPEGIDDEPLISENNKDDANDTIHIASYSTDSDIE